MASRTKHIEDTLTDLGDIEIHPKRDGHIVFPEEFRFVKSLNLETGPRLTSKFSVRTPDSPALLRKRLAAMALDERRRARIRYAILNIYTIVRRADYINVDLAAASERGHTNSLGMRIRKFHDELGLHVNDNVLGAIYRSGVAFTDLQRAVDVKPKLHQEHTIPSNIVAAMIWKNLRGADLPKLAEFLLTETVVTAVANSEKIGLNTKRSCIAGDSPSTWSHKHPVYNRHTAIGDHDARPFLRYVGTEPELKVFSWLGQGDDPEPIVLANYKLQDHKERIKPYPLFDWRTYFDRDGLPAPAPSVDQWPTLKVEVDAART